jgi:hypothetical protein
MCVVADVVPEAAVVATDPLKAQPLSRPASNVAAALRASAGAPDRVPRIGFAVRISDSRCIKSLYCAVKLCITGVAALKLLLPACVAVTVTEPLPVMVSVVPLIDA